MILSKFKKKDRLYKIPATVLGNYSGGLLAISIDVDTYEFDKNEQLLIDYKLCNLINDDECHSIINSYNEKKN